MTTLELIHSKGSDIFEYFHDFRISYNLKYYAIGRTLLRAMCHNGYIPSDDDSDVGTLVGVTSVKDIQGREVLEETPKYSFEDKPIAIVWDYNEYFA